MHIAIIVRRLNVCGGTQKLAVQVARELRSQGHAVTFYTFFYSKEECYPELLSEFAVVSADPACVARMKETGAARGPVAFLKNYRNENRAARQLAAQISSDTDILNPHDQLAYRVSRYFKREVKHVPSIWVMNDLSTKKASLMRNVASNLSPEISLFKRIWYWCVDTFEYWWFVRFQEAIVVLDNRTKLLADEAFPSVTTVIVRGGLDITDFPYRKRQRVNAQSVHLLMFAVLLPHRRFEDGITAVSLLRKQGMNVTLSIVGGVGDTHYHRMLQELVSMLDLEGSVHFKGKVSHEELLREYQEADIFIFPSHLQSWGLAVFEAMASGLPSIVSETSGASEVLQNDENAMIVPPHNPERIVASVKRLIENPALYENLSQEGRKFVEENISWKRYAESIQKLFVEKLRK